MKNIVAFFDIDGTLHRDSLLIEHFKKLVKYELIDSSIWHNEIKKTFQDWNKRQDEFDNYLQQLCKIYEKELYNI
ncbi:MAG: HAD-IB family hydrolase, partial [Romboutsia sp.]|nr:HAD-IB family hydrolase [Romboutsia sp.]